MICSKERDSERIDNGGDGGAVTFDDKSLKLKKKYWNGEQQI
jgi:hypothetical protein